MDKHAPAKPCTVAVFCGSSPGAKPIFEDVAERFGTLVAEAGFRFLFGGGRLGLMGKAAQAAHDHGARVVGVLPEFLRHLEPPLKGDAEEVVWVDTMFERKKLMTEWSDAFVVLPGGIGTVDEFFEVLVGAQLLTHQKPIVVVNVEDYFDPLVDLVQHIVQSGFAGEASLALFTVVPTPEDAIAVLKALLARQQPHAGSGLPD
jgi:uncharacterized protein (TIGR00730 family)